MPRARTRDEVMNIMIECDCSGRLSRATESYPCTTFAERLARYPEPKGYRYIAGDVRRDGIHWCDAPITVFGRSYCEEHFALCWREAKS